MASLRTAVGILRPAPPFPAIALFVGSNVVGRGRGGVLDPRVSREHALISVSEEEGEVSFSLTCLGALMCVSKGGVVARLARDDAIPLAAGDSISLLPKLHRFELELAGRSTAAPPASPAASHPQSVPESQPPAAKRQHLEDGGAGSGSGGGGGGGGADGTHGADGAASCADDSRGGDDWLGMVLPPYVQPAKPTAMEGLGALERLATSADAPSERVLLLTRQLVVAYDVYPKARARRGGRR